MRHLIPGQPAKHVSIYKRPGGETLLSRAVVQFGIAQTFDTLILTTKYNYRSVPLWASDEEVARKVGCSPRTFCRWRWFHRFYKYRTDNPPRQSRSKDVQPQQLAA